MQCKMTRCCFNEPSIRIFTFSLLMQVKQLKTEIEEVGKAYSRLLAELEAMEMTKTEKNV